MIIAIFELRLTQNYAYNIFKLILRTNQRIMTKVNGNGPIYCNFCAQASRLQKLRKVFNINKYRLCWSYLFWKFWTIYIVNVNEHKFKLLIIQQCTIHIDSNAQIYRNSDLLFIPIGNNWGCIKQTHTLLCDKRT